MAFSTFHNVVQTSPPPIHTKIKNKFQYDPFTSGVPWLFTQMSLKFLHTKMCIWMFIAGLFIMAKPRKQPRRSSIERISKPRYIQTMERYLVLKRNEFRATEKHGGTLNAY